MKKILSLIFLGALIINFGCENEDLDPRPDLNDSVGAVTLVTLNPTKTFFNANNDLNLEEVEFEIDVDGFDITEVTSVDIVLVYTEKDGAIDPFLGIVDSVYAPINLGTISTFPSTVTITGAQVATALTKTVGDFEVGDSFEVTFPITTADGRVLTVALSSDLCNQPAQPSFGGCSVAWGIACPSELAATVDWEITSSNWPASTTTGTFDMVETGSNGVYTWGTYTFGFYQFNYGCCEQTSASALKIVDVCQTLSLTPADSFGCPWSMTVDSVVGDVLTVTLSAGCGGGVTTVALTRQDGSNWDVIP